MKKGLVAPMSAAVLAIVLLAGACSGGGGGGGPYTPVAGDGFRKGPDPSDTGLNAAPGPFAIQSLVVPGSGFGGGTIYYPTEPGVYGGIAVVPGFVSAQSTIQWYGPALASRGFVVITIDTNSPLDQPASRGDQLLAALTTIKTNATVASKVDPNRLGVMGWSMGGGGSLEAAAKNGAIKGLVSLAGWNTTTNWARLMTPALVVACQGDSIAPESAHSVPFYNSLGGEKAYLEIATGNHFCPTTPNNTIAKYAISWMKRWIDNDTRYTGFICNTPETPAPPLASEWHSSCPM